MVAADQVVAAAILYKPRLPHIEQCNTKPITMSMLLCLEFHDFSIAHARNRPDTADVAPSLASQASNLRPPIERPNPTFSIVSRNQASGRGSTAVATAFGSSLRSADTLLGLVTRRTPASPRLKRLMRTDAKTLSVSPSDRV